MTDMSTRKPIEGYSLDDILAYMSINSKIEHNYTEMN